MLGKYSRAVTLAELWETGRTGQSSLFALRQRATEGTLAYLFERRGAAMLYDETVSLIRLQAAARAFRPGVTWRQIGEAFKNLSIIYLNEAVIDGRIVELLESGEPSTEVVDFVLRQLRERIGFSEGF